MTQKLLNVCGVLFFALSLGACNGSSGDNDVVDGIDQVPVVNAISVVVLDSNCDAVSGNAFVLGESVCVQATLTQDGSALNGEIITFNAGIGELSAATKLTDASGVAQVTLGSTNANIGAASLTASFGETNGSVNYEFLAAPSITETQSSIRVNLFNEDGNPVTRFRANEEVRIQATLLNSDDAPLINEIINFQSTSGALSVSQALTNDQGFAQVTMTPSDLQLGAATVTATFNGDDEPVTNSLNFEVQSIDTVNDSIVRFGYFEGGIFIENTLGFANFTANDDVTISSGATLGILVGLADENDQAITTSTPVTFTSRCVQNNDATIDTQVNTINGIANATYEDQSCAGGAGNEDTITATVNVNASTITISRELTLAAESVGAIEFISASPENIVLQGTGGQGSQSVSTLTFQVNGAQGNALSQQTVNFSLNTNTGGLTLFPATGITNSQGQVSVKVTAGNVPTSVRVTAEVAVGGSETIQTQSDLLTVNTGLPDQNSITLSASNLNPEAFNFDNVEVSIFASLADTFNNPVPNGTAISFTTEGGRIQPSCNTINGACSVIWASSNPSVTDHRVTILATAIGHETLLDSNGNNQYDDADGPAITTNDGSGFDVTLPTTSGFVDLSEAWRDDNENRVKDANEVFLDFDSSGSFDPQNGLFDGPQCTGSSCGNTSVHVRRALTIVTSSSSAIIAASNNGIELASTSTSSSATPVLSIVRGESALFEYTYSDTAIQPIPSGSTINVSSAFGATGGTVSDVMPGTNRNGSRTRVFSLTNSLLSGDSAIDTTVTITITTPAGVVTTLTFVVTLE